MASRRPVLLGCAAALLSLAAPASASAATVAPAQGCALSGTPSFALTTGGWAPGAPLTFRLNGNVVGSGVADPAGNYGTPTPLVAPVLSRPRVKTFRLTATDGVTVAGPVDAKVVRRGVVVPSRSRPTRVVRYRAFGFPPRARLYLHVRRGGRTKGDFRLGRPRGACGLLTRKLRYMPLRRWSTGVYEYWFSNTRRFRRSTNLYGYRISIYRTYRPRTAGASAASAASSGGWRGAQAPTA